MKSRTMMTTKAASLLLLLTRTTVVDAVFEWAGTFDLADASHTWSMQAIDGEYADPSMRLVFYVTSDTSQEGIEANEADANTLLTSDNCPVVQAGETIGPFDATTGNCYELTVGTDPDSLFPMDTTDVPGIAVFAQHVPIEFERDQHYLKDSAGVDIEPVAQEGGGDGHDHGHGHDGHGDEMMEGELHSCACEAEELDFKIDCTNNETMLTALAATKTNGCSTDCSSEICERNFLIIQTHHDYCPPQQVPHEVQDGFHDVEEKCKHCAISRKYDANNPACPMANCEDQSGNDAHTRAVEAGCATDCSSDACRDDYLILRAVHDDCPHDTLTGAAEDGLHDMELTCIQHSCNNVGPDVDQLVCVKEEGDTEVPADAEPSAAAGKTSVVVIMWYNMIGALAVLFMSI